MARALTLPTPDSTGSTLPYEQAAARLIDYLWAEERKHFEALEADDRGGHIFPALQCLRYWFERGLVSFPLGRMLSTPGALEKLSASDIQQALQRHQVGDWGNICAEDWQANEDALEDGSRLFSVYHAADGTRFWVITEADRAATTVLLPEEY